MSKFPDESEEQGRDCSVASVPSRSYPQTCAALWLTFSFPVTRYPAPQS